MNLNNNTTDINLEMYVTVTESSTGIRGEQLRTTNYHNVLSGQLLIHQHEPDDDDAQTAYDYYHSVKVKKLTMQKLTGALYPSQVMVRYATFNSARLIK